MEGDISINLASKKAVFKISIQQLLLIWDETLVGIMTHLTMISLKNSWKEKSN